MARRLANDRRFAFGTWKIEILGGFTSALLLLLIAASMAYQSFERLLRPATIHYDQAIAIAVVGLLVNRSEEHTSELQSLMRISYAVFCLKKKNKLQI